MVDIRNNAKRLLNRNPYLVNLFKSLNKDNIRYGLYAGTYVSLINSTRVPTDIDIMLANEDSEKVKKLFRIEHITKGKKIKAITTIAEFLYLFDGEVEFVSNLNVVIGKSSYPVYLTKLVWKNTASLVAKNVRIRMLPPEDTVIIKAILQRGKSYGKHDLGDIEAIVKVTDLDGDYLTKRLAEVKADRRVLKVLNKYMIL